MIKISVIIVTYNHEKYINKAIDSVLSQKGDFELELLVGDDCSKDSTPELVKQYADRYPDVVTAILRKPNMGARANMKDLIDRCTGKYVAFLDGDDYWIDDYKLYKQMQVLENNSNVVSVYGKHIIVDSEGVRHEEVEQYVPAFKGTNYSLKDFQEHLLPGQTSSVMHRAEVLHQVNQSPTMGDIKYTPGDRILALFFLGQGDIVSLRDCVCAYRYQLNSSSGTWSSKNDVHQRETQYKFLCQLRELEKLAKCWGMNLNYDERRLYEYKKARFDGKRYWKNRFTLIAHSRNKFWLFYKLISYKFGLKQ